MQLFATKKLSVSIDDDIFTFSNSDGSSFYIPAGEYWAIASAFDGHTPSAWSYGKIERYEILPNGFILYGQIPLNDGLCRCRDCCTFQHGMLKIRRRWHYTGSAVGNITLSYRFRQRGTDAKVLIPAVIYYGNPSGKKTPGVPFLNGVPGEKAFFEEHRLPMPFVSAENAIDHNLGAIHTVPSPVPQAARNDSWWSIGVEYRNDSLEIAGYSGFVSCNGKDGFVKSGQQTLSELPGNGMTLTDQMIVEKTFFLQTAAGTEKGSAFIPAVDAALKIWRINSLPIDLHTLIGDKYRYALNREYTDGKVSGSLFNSAANGPSEIVFGWCGRSETLGFAAPVIGKFFGDNDAGDRAERYFDFLVSRPVDERGFPVEYFIDTGISQDHNFVSQGQTMETFAMALQAQTASGKTVKKEYLAFLEKVCQAFYNRIMAPDWNPVSTNEAFLGAPLAIASKLLKNNDFRDAALHLADYYIARHCDMTEPYWGGTLDACCEDKEGAVAAMTAFYAAWELTGKSEYLNAAGHACAIYLTYVQMWDIPLPPGRLADNFFRSSGWTAVSVQNMHLDVYGVWVAPLLWKIASALDKKSWLDLVIPTVINCGQLTDIFGSQGEQIEQTNFSQQPGHTDVESLRGGYSEQWQVFWITAAFLNTAAQFQLLGITSFSE